jgi:NAD(P)-binding Rossmann-like domain
MKITRGQFLAGGLAGSLSLALGFRGAAKTQYPSIPGKIVGASSSIGHRLRSGGFPAISRTIDTSVVVVGTGIAGLAAGRRLAKAGFQDFMLLELESDVGGNAASGENTTTAYPWGAHYVPLLTEEAKSVRILFEDLGIITGKDEKGLPIYNELYLGADPKERLYMFGRWHEGLVPALGITEEDEHQYSRFFGLMEDYKARRGRDGKRPFSIPVDMSSQDPEWLALDDMTMSDWMDLHAFTSKPLRWYVNYCCRDDFGMLYTDASAWAGIHYFASRNGVAANAGSGDVVTWPEGNGWLAKRMSEPLRDRIIKNALAYQVEIKDGKSFVHYWDSGQDQSVTISCDRVILATPRFISSRLRTDTPPNTTAEGFSYAPWMVANVSLSAMPLGRGASLSWDNVVYDSEMLGYVVATNQIPESHPLRTVLTYYWPLTHLQPDGARREALSRPIEEWQQRIMIELLHVHPELKGKIERIDVCLWGHAMIRPEKGFIWGELRRKANQQSGTVLTAHSDMSGISIFEEAYTQGVRAAEIMLTQMGYSTESELA